MQLAAGELEALKHLEEIGETLAAISQNIVEMVASSSSRNSSTTTATANYFYCYWTTSTAATIPATIANSVVVKTMKEIRIIEASQPGEISYESIPTFKIYQNMVSQIIPSPGRGQRSNFEGCTKICVRN